MDYCPQMMPPDAFIDDGGVPPCANCGTTALACRCKLGGLWYCEPCAGNEVAGIAEEAEQFAHDNVRLVGELKAFDEALRFAPSRDEYAAGEREAYTKNAVDAANRHTGTNYDDLIRCLDRDDERDQIFYWAIRARVNELTGADEEV